jgi:hypothetical protein
MVQEQYWKELFQLKLHVGYIELLLEGSEWVDRIIKIVLAVTSSASIAAWAVWQEHALVWAFIIAISQVLTAVNPFLPYRDRIKAYSALSHELEEILIQAEFKWHSIASGNLTEEEINQARFEVRSQKQKSLKKHTGSSTIPFKEKLHKKADSNARVYFSTFYS